MEHNVVRPDTKQTNPTNRMPKDVIHLERMAINKARRRDPYWRRPHGEPKPEIDPAPPLEKRMQPCDMYHHFKDLPSAPNAIKRTFSMESTIRRGITRMPAAGHVWHTRRCEEARTVTEEDLAQFKEDRAKHARDWNGDDVPWCKDAETQTDEALKMYSLSRSPNAPSTYDTYAGAVVVARNEDEAKFIHPSYGYPDPKTKDRPWWEWGGRWGEQHGFETRQEAYDEETMAKYRENKEEDPPECPPHFLGRHTDWPHPGYVRATYVCDYYGKEKSGYIVSNDFWPG